MGSGGQDQSSFDGPKSQCRSDNGCNSLFFLYKFANNGRFAHDASNGFFSKLNVIIILNVEFFSILYPFKSNAESVKLFYFRLSSVLQYYSINNLKLITTNVTIINMNSLKPINNIFIQVIIIFQIYKFYMTVFLLMKF